MRVLAWADPPDGVRMVSIAAAATWWASPNTRVAGATNVTVPVDGAHAHMATWSASDAAPTSWPGAGGASRRGARARATWSATWSPAMRCPAVEDATGVAALATVP